MTPQELKSSILQLAMQGKHVEHLPTDGNVDGLEDSIILEKKALVRSGETKKEKSLPNITEDEIPFDVPDNWRWFRLRTVVYNRGQTVPQQLFSYIDIGSIDNKNQRLNKEDNLIEAADAPSRARKIVRQGDILYSTVRPYLHNMCIIDREFSHTPIASTGFAAMTCHTGIFNKYLFYYLLSPDFDRYANNTENSKGVAYPAINDDRLYQAVVPIPPLAEQHRIVDKIEELLPLIDRYEKAYTRLEDFNKRFPADMQKSILQLAIKGELVEQRPEDGTGEELYQQIQKEKAALIKAGKIKKEKPYSNNINYQEYPFEIPNSWTFVRFGELMISRDSERVPVSTFDRQKRKKVYDYYGASGVIDKIDDFLFDKQLLLIGEDGANLLARSTPIAFLADGKYWVNNHAHVLDGCSGLYLKYIAYYINAISLSPYVTGTAQPKMNQENMNAIWVPLPPLAEQRRIVARLEELLPLCDRLK